MAAVAAYRVGCGLVTAAVAESVRPILAGLLPEATFLVLPEDLGVISRAAAPLVLEVLPECDAMVLGPGLTTQPPAAEFVAALLAGQGPPHHGAIGFAAGPPDRDGSPAAPAGPDGLPARLVVDADGLNLLGRQGLARLPAGCVLTPHPGEMARLAGKSTREIQEDRLAAAREAASAWGHVVVLKGAFTVVASPDGRATIMPFANAALAKGGTGDVLTGAIGGLLAQGMEARDAAVAGAYVHGLAGELAAAAVGPRAVTASDVAERLGRAFAQIEAAD
jgi:NAD(P)H-hydrate repair Nnr-like enzyme with NAD(P)H-hydrate dehydratase domain